MQAVRISRNGGPEVLELVDREPGDPGPDEVLVEVAAAGVNFIDRNHRMGVQPLELPAFLGMEGAGTVLAVGADVTGFGAGDTVAWAGVRGSYATHVTVPSDRLVRVPDGLDVDLAAATMLQGMTAHYLSHSTYALDSDDTALVLAAAGGVGRLLVQLAKRRGARVIAGTSTPEKAQEVTRLGADEVILYRDVNLAEAARELTDGEGVDVVYDSVGRATFDASLASLRPRGMLVVFGHASGKVEPFDILRLIEHGSLFLTRPVLGHHIQTSSELEWRAHAVLELVRTGLLDVHVHGRYPLADAAEAHRDLESTRTTGKLLLVP